MKTTLKIALALLVIEAAFSYLVADQVGGFAAGLFYQAADALENISGR